MIEVVMDEEEWLTGNNAGRLIEHVHPDPWSWPRKYRLLNCACCRRLSPWFDDNQFAQAIDRAERGADSGLTEATLRKWQSRIEDIYYIPERPAAEARAAQAVASLFADRSTSYSSVIHGWRALCGDHEMFGPTFAATAPEIALGLVRDAYGNPFRPVAFDPGWQTEAVVGVARGMYDGRDFAAMPVLADALEDAGCDHPDVLAHCRDPQGVHVRGCWVVDGVLGLS